MASLDHHIIKEGDQIILKKEKVLKLFQIRKNRLCYVDKAKFSLAAAVGLPYGTTFEVKDGQLVKVESPSLTSTSVEAPSGQDNRKLLDTDANQKLSRDDIEALKDKGITGENLVEHIVENSATFKNKTEFSQQKYIKKKKKKHLNIFTILKPSTRLLFEMYLHRGASKVSFLRLDTLSQILNQGNVRPHCKLLVFETCQGLLLGSMMERMAGTGKLVQLYSGQAPVKQALEGFQFPQEYFKHLYCFPLNQANSLKVKTSNTQEALESTTKKESDMTCTVSDTSDVPVSMDIVTSAMEGTETIRATDEVVGETTDECVQNKDESEVKNGDSVKDTSTAAESSECEPPVKKQKTEVSSAMEERVDRRKQREQKISEAQDIIEQADMDGLIVASKLHPTSIVMKLIDFVMPSRPLVVFCQYKEPLVDCYMKLRKRGGVVNLRLTETWYREHQVLPQRTHPVITMSGTGGFLLTGLVVAVD